MDDGVPLIGDNSQVRLAILEDRLKRVEDRLEVVSARTHTLINSVNLNNQLADEAREQRADLIANVQKIDAAVDTLENATLRATLSLEHHVETCDRRAARNEKYLMAITTALLMLIVSVVGGTAVWFVTH